MWLKVNNNILSYDPILARLKAIVKIGVEQICPGDIKEKLVESYEGFELMQQIENFMQNKKPQKLRAFLSVIIPWLGIVNEV